MQLDLIFAPCENVEAHCMFCGIVDHVGTVKFIEQKTDGLLLRIQTQFNDFVVGESIAVDGACLTVIDSQHNNFDCQLSPETTRVTIANSYQIGQVVNLERAMRLNDRIGGHLVTGHVEETIVVKDQIQHDGFIENHFCDYPDDKRAFLIDKGSITINGVSLTVNTVDTNHFSLLLIPHTLERTNLSNLVPGQRVNVEWDYVARLILNKTKTSRTLVSGLNEE